MSLDAEGVAAVVEAIDKLEHDPDSLIGPGAHEKYRFVRTKAFGGKQGHGFWSKKGTDSIAVIRFVGKLGAPLCGPYGDLEGAPKSAVSDLNFQCCAVVNANIG